MALSSLAFLAGAAVSLATSWILVSRLERVGERLGLTEALLGLLAALAADAPEITASITALIQNQRAIGAGVIIGSNVFNLAALLGLSAAVAGFIALHRKVVLLGGSVALWVAVITLGTVLGVLSPGLGLGIMLLALVPYVAILGASRTRARLPLPAPWKAWLASAVDEEELELVTAIRPARGRPIDFVTAGGALAVVVLASIAMERGASDLGQHFRVPEAVVGGLVLAAVTSLPNAVASVHLASRGRGAATFSTALNSNSLNVVAGLLLPAVIIGLATPSGPGTLIAGWYLGLTVLSLVLAYAGSGLGRPAGLLIVAAYAAFVGWLLATT